MTSGRPMSPGRMARSGDLVFAQALACSGYTPDANWRPTHRSARTGSPSLLLVKWIVNRRPWGPRSRLVNVAADLLERRGGK